MSLCLPLKTTAEWENPGARVLNSTIPVTTLCFLHPSAHPLPLVSEMSLMLKIEEKDESQRNGCARNKMVSGMVQSHQVNLDLFIIFFIYSCWEDS